MQKTEKIWGIDYGSKMAGTSAIAYLEKNTLKTVQSLKKKDADQFILNHSEILNPSLVFLDAPLSLPGIYAGVPDCDDYFYRRADRELKAMSPMFLGGLTARAMRLKAMLEKKGTEVIEIYPAHLAKKLNLREIGYKKNKESIPQVAERLQALLPYSIGELPQNWHQIDAILAFYSGYRYLANEYESFGNPLEGMIYV